MYRCAAYLWHANISGDVASARAEDRLTTVDSTARAIKRSSMTSFLKPSKRQVNIELAAGNHRKVEAGDFTVFE
jgi:hypothetical protein